MHVLAWQITDAGCQKSLVKTKTHCGHLDHNGHSSRPKIFSEGLRSSCTSFPIDLALWNYTSSFSLLFDTWVWLLPCYSCRLGPIPVDINQEGLVGKQGLRRLLSPVGTACHSCQMTRSGQVAMEVDWTQNVEFNIRAWGRVFSCAITMGLSGFSISIGFPLVKTDRIIFFVW